MLMTGILVSWNLSLDFHYNRRCTRCRAASIYKVRSTVVCNSCKVGRGRWGRWVLSPEASLRIASSIDTEALYKYAYYYEYDWLKRMTFKKLPGCEPVYMVYDKRDRLVLTQDGNMRASNGNKWSYTEYNTKNRPVESGEIVLSSGATHAQLIDSMMDSESVLSGIRTPLQYIRYDKYTANEHVTPHAFVAVPGYAEDYHRLTVGRVTATKTRVLGTDQWITSTIYYDSKCRPMQEITDNLVGGDRKSVV